MSGYAVADATGAINRWGNCSDGMEMMQATEPGEIAALCGIEIQAALNAAAQRSKTAPYRISISSKNLEAAR